MKPKFVDPHKIPLVVFVAAYVSLKLLALKV